MCSYIAHGNWCGDCCLSDLSWPLVHVSLGCLYPYFYIPGVRGYKEGSRVGYNMIPIRTLSLLAYFTYIFIDTIIYALGSTAWSSRIFWMVDRVIADPSLGLPSLCSVVPRVPIVITMRGQNAVSRIVTEGVSKDRTHLQQPLTQHHKSIHLALEVKIFFDNSTPTTSLSMESST
jgi:hypothetical protein